MLAFPEITALCAGFLGVLGVVLAGHSCGKYLVNCFPVPFVR